MGGGSNLDAGLLSDLEEDLHKLRSDFETHKLDSAKQFRNVNDALDDKATKLELEQLEQRLMDKLQELLNNLGNVFVEKEPVRKKFLNIEKNVGLFYLITCQLKNLYDMVMDGKGKMQVEDDAMLTKKYVGPVNCASCEKGIINLQGMPAEYLAWKRLPFREPQERIARVSFIWLTWNSTGKVSRRSST